MTFLSERLAELRKHLDHLYEIRPRVRGVESFREDLSLHNDVLFSLLTVVQLLIDIAGELSARAGRSFSDYSSAVRNLDAYPGFDRALIEDLARLPGFRNVLLHEYVELDLGLAVEALGDLEPLERFLRIVSDLEAS